jgi:hypothetical protein
MRDRIAKVIGDYYDGYVSKDDTPNSWERATSAADLVLAEMREPTVAMLDKVQYDIYDWGANNWRAMIDEAASGTVN